MKSIELKNYNLPEDRILLAVIDAKPNVELMAVALVGLILVTFDQYVTGAGLIIFAVCSIIFLPKRVLVEFYSDYLVLFNHANKNDCELIYYSEIVKWSYNSGFSYDELNIILVDDSTHKIDGFSRLLFEKQMNRFLKDKREKTKRGKK